MDFLQCSEDFVRMPAPSAQISEDCEKLPGIRIGATGRVSRQIDEVRAERRQDKQTPAARVARVLGSE